MPAYVYVYGMWVYVCTHSWRYQWGRGGAGPPWLKAWRNSLYRLYIGLLVFNPKAGPTIALDGKKGKKSEKRERE